MLTFIGNLLYTINRIYQPTQCYLSNKRVSCFYSTELCGREALYTYNQKIFHCLHESYSRFSGQFDVRLKHAAVCWVIDLQRSDKHTVTASSTDQRCLLIN